MRPAVEQQILLAMHEIACIRWTDGLPFVGVLVHKQLENFTTEIEPSRYPDIAVIREDMVDALIDNGLATGLGSFMKDDFAKGIDISFDLPVGFLSSFRRGGGTWYALPFISCYRMLLFNKTTLAGLELPFPPPYNLTQNEWTWDKFLEYSNVIKEAFPVCLSICF